MSAAFTFEEHGVRVNLPQTTGTLWLKCVPAQAVFANIHLAHFAISSDRVAQNTRTLEGRVEGSDLVFRGEWEIDPSGWIRFGIELQGFPDPAWGAFEKLILLDQEMPSSNLQSNLGWRELGGTAQEALVERPREEGGGLQPPFGFPIFGPDFFLGAEHPMACLEAERSRVSIFHHPLWKGEKLTSVPMVMGVCRDGESVEEAFARYFATIRRPKPDRAIVEINTFWTDQFDNNIGYTTDLASYRAMANGWAEDVLGAERGLVSHFLLDAGWHDPASLYRPQASNGGPCDDKLAELGRGIEAEGFSLGLWFSLNGPIGINPEWAQSKGYRTSNAGTGSAYSTNHGKTRYICLTDERWEKDLGDRFVELIGNVPVTFFKGDWDNDAIEDPARFPAAAISNLQLREEIANAMIRIYQRIHHSRSGVAVRGAWWLSPWWFRYVESTHLPNSGDHENSDIPSLTHRDSGITCRDAICFQVMVRSQSPVPWDVICPHEFASSRRNPVQDTEDSWMNNLAMWSSRGSQYLQLYLAPYGLEGWKAWSIRKVLRWFRSNEELHWKAGTSMLGADPMSGHPYAYLHRSGECRLLTIRNPLAHPQPLPDLAAWGLPADGWEQIYPYCRSFDAAGYYLASHEVLILTRGGGPPRDDVLVNTPSGWCEPWQPRQPIPDLHTLGVPKARFEVQSQRQIAIHATLPYGFVSAEVVLSVRSSRSENLRAGVGRYPEDVASFGVPITHVRPHWQSGYAQGRLKTEPYDAALSVLRFPIGTGGDAHAFLRSEEVLPEILGGWIEGRENLRPTEAWHDLPRPPAMSAPLKHITKLPGLIAPPEA